MLLLVKNLVVNIGIELQGKWIDVPCKKISDESLCIWYLSKNESFAIAVKFHRFEFMIHTSAALLAAVSFPPITTIDNNSMIMNTVNTCTCMQYIGL